ncbi:MAG TPA: hypothetical protein ENI99_03470 [Sedimenticola sp.]|nr:hypothetical protein [Sedimenticola sp.]
MWCFKMRYFIRQRGLTLVELMISMGLSLVLLLAMTTMFAGQKQTSRSGNAVADLNETGRIALDILSQDIRMTSFQGCAPHDADIDEDKDTRAKLVSEARDASGNPYPWTGSLLGYETDVAGWETGAGADITKLADGDNANGEVIAGTDIIVIEYADSAGRNITAPISPTSNIPVPNDLSKTIPQNGQFLISDCEEANIVVRTDDPGSVGGALKHAGSPLTKSFGTDAVVRKLISNIYFVGPTGRTTASGQPINALFVRSDGNNTPTELLAGVDNMQIMYGQPDAAGSGIQFFEADDSSIDFDLVTHVKIGVLASSGSAVKEKDDEKSYMLAGVTVTTEGGGGVATHPKDKQLRRVFNTTINIRNRRSEF